MAQQVPHFEDFCCISDDVALAAEISSVFNKPDRYFALLDGPQLPQPDAENEVIRRSARVTIWGVECRFHNPYSYPCSVVSLQPGVNAKSSVFLDRPDSPFPVNPVSAISINARPDRWGLIGALVCLTGAAVFL